MADGYALAKMLEEEYGITTIEELDSAIRNMEVFDISPFCSKPVRKEAQKCQEKKGKRKEKPKKDEVEISE